MVKRIREYVKYTLKELEEYTAIEDSCVKKIHSTMHIGLMPYGLNNIRESILENVTHNKIGFFDNKLQGIILDVKKMKILNKSGTIRSDDPTIHIDISADCYVFQPQIGAVIRGIVKHISNSGTCFIGVIIYRVFSVSIKLQDNIKRNIQINSEIEFRIKDFNLQCSMPFIEGELIAKDEMSLNDETTIEYVNIEDNGISNENSNQSEPVSENNKELELSYALANSAQLHEDEDYEDEVIIEQSPQIKVEISDHDMFSDHDSNLNISDFNQMTPCQDSNKSTAENHMNENDKIENCIKETEQEKLIETEQEKLIEAEQEKLIETTLNETIKDEIESVLGTQSDNDKQSLNLITKTKRKRIKFNSSSLNDSIKNILIKTELKTEHHHQGRCSPIESSPPQLKTEQSQLNDFEFLSPKPKEPLQSNKKKKKSIDNLNSSNFKLEIDQLLFNNNEIEHENSIQNQNIKVEPVELKIQLNGISELNVTKTKTKRKKNLDLELNDILSSFETENSDLEQTLQSRNKKKKRIKTEPVEHNIEQNADNSSLKEDSKLNGNSKLNMTKTKRKKNLNSELSDIFSSLETENSDLEQTLQSRNKKKKSIKEVSKLNKNKTKRKKNLDLELNDILSSFETENSDLEEMSQSKKSLNDSLFEILNDT